MEELWDMIVRYQWILTTLQHPRASCLVGTAVAAVAAFYTGAKVAVINQPRRPELQGMEFCGISAGKGEIWPKSYFYGYIYIYILDLG